MAYMSTEHAKKIRENLKKAFPNYRFAVRKRHYTSIDVVIKKAPHDYIGEYIKMERERVERSGDPYRREQLENWVANVEKRGSFDVNHYWIDDMSGEPNYPFADDLKRIYEIVNEGNFDKSDIMTDYFHVGFYVSISVGEWDKPFECTSNK